MSVPHLTPSALQIADGDAEAVSAILTAHPAASGFDRKDFQLLRDKAERKFSPAEYGERQSPRAMRERLTGAGNHYLARLRAKFPVSNLREAEGARALQKLRTGV